MTTESIEDYLETIYLIDKNKKEVRVKDISLRLGIKLSSVTEMIRKLSEKGYVLYQKYGPIRLTKKGKDIAKDIFDRHILLTDFFKMIGVSEKKASEDACKCEHILSKETIKKIEQHITKVIKDGNNIVRS